LKTFVCLSMQVFNGMEDTLYFSQVTVIIVTCSKDYKPKL
jgi:hypothetical protein